MEPAWDSLSPSLSAPSLHTLSLSQNEQVFFKDEKITSVGEDLEKLAPSHIVGRMQNGATTMVTNMKVSQKIKSKATIGSNNSISGYMSK